MSLAEVLLVTALAVLAVSITVADLALHWWRRRAIPETGEAAPERDAVDQGVARREMIRRRLAAIQAADADETKQV